MTTSRGFHAVSLAAALMLGSPAAQARHHGVNVSIDDRGGPQRCGDIAIRFDGRPAERAEERLAVAPEAGRPLRVRIPEHSGVQVRGAEPGDFEVLACKAAPSKASLEGISLSRDGDTLTVRGPSGSDWVGYLIIAAPRNTSIELEAVNGPIGISDMAGHVRARSQNGPISVRDSVGDIDVEAENGPIEARGDGGRVRLRTENGPIDVVLSGVSWKGEGLEARAVNGPLSLAIPAGYLSATVVESLGRSPFRCRGEACAAARHGSNDDRKRLELGEGPAIVRLSTENGPVSIATGQNELNAEDEE